METDQSSPCELAPYTWALPDALEIPPDKLQARLDFYGNAVVLHLLGEGEISTKLVSAGDVVLALLREVPLTSGLLPKGTLWWSQTRDGPEVALWRSARVWKVALVTEPLKPPRRLALPMPGLIFICQPARPPKVFAVKKRPRSTDDEVYHAPIFNLFGDGRTCPGTHQFPENIQDIPESFFTSFFTTEAVPWGRSQRHPDSLESLWDELDGKKRYCFEDLVPCGRVKDIMR